MFLYHLLSVAARAITLKAHSKDELPKIAEIYNVNTPDLSILYDETIGEGKYVMVTQNVEVQAEDLFELKELLTAAENLTDVPSQINEIFNSLKDAKEDLVADLKSGAYNFAIFLTNKPEHIKLLKGLEDASGFKYFLSSDEKLAKSLNAEFPSIVAYNAYDKNVLRLPFYGSFSAICAAITVRAINKISNDSFRQLQELEQSVYYVVDKAENFDRISRDFGKLFKDQASQSKFVFFNPEEIPTLIRLVKAEDKDYPMMIHLLKEQKGIVRGLTAGNFLQSMESLRSNKAESLRFASTIPEDNEQRGLKVLNSDTIVPLMEDVSSDRVIAFTSPKCGHCTTMKPELLRFATELKERNVDITVGEYNVIENEEVPGLEITGVPVLYYMKKGSKEFVQLGTDVRTYETLLLYVAQNGLSAQVKPEDYFAKTAGIKEQPEHESKQEKPTVEHSASKEAEMAQPAETQKEVL